MGIFGNPASYPPGTRGLPVVGVLTSVGDYPNRDFKKWSLENYGPIFYVNMGSRRQIILNTVESIREVLEMHSNITLGRPLSYVFDQDDGVSFLDDTKKFTSQKAFGVAALKSIEDNGHGLQKIILEEWKHFQNHMISVQDQPIELASFTYRISGNILMQALVGDRFDYTNEGNVVMLLKTTLAGSEDFKSILAAELMPWLRYLPPFRGALSRYDERRKVVKDLIHEIVVQHEKDFSEDNPENWLDYMLISKQHDQKETSKYFTTLQMTNYIVDILGGGINNASVSWLWTVLCALLYPEFQKKVVAEIDKVYGKDEDPTWETRTKLPYTCAFMDEVYRTCCPLTRTVTHDTNAELKLSKYTLPKGVEISGNIWGAHHDPNTWPDPMKFDPNRHLDVDGNYVSSKNLIPFGVGPRTCFAEYLARIEVFLLLVKIFQQYEVTAFGQLPGIYDGTEKITYDPQPFHVVLKLRS